MKVRRPKPTDKGYSEKLTADVSNSLRASLGRHPTGKSPCVISLRDVLTMVVRDRPASWSLSRLVQRSSSFRAVAPPGATTQSASQLAGEDRASRRCACFETCHRVARPSRSRHVKVRLDAVISIPRASSDDRSRKWLIKQRRWNPHAHLTPLLSQTPDAEQP